VISAVAFDLDDTLFLERDFVRSGFRAVARLLQGRFGMRTDWFAELWRGFEAGVRGDAFNRVLAGAGLPDDPELVVELVRCYREHRPAIDAPEDVVPALRALGLSPDKVGVVTDGPPEMQQRKFEALALQEFVGHVIATDRWGLAFRKPHPRAFEEFERLAGCSPAECAYVADNPAKDFEAPHTRGWRTVRVRRDGGLHAEEPSRPGEVDRTLTDLARLPEALAVDGG